MNIRDCWSTPDEIFQPWHNHYKFTVDACALVWNAKLSRFWTPEQDGLQQDWRGERIWCNPPYSRGEIQKWVNKALIAL